MEVSMVSVTVDTIAKLTSVTVKAIRYVNGAKHILKRATLAAEAARLLFLLVGFKERARTSSARELWSQGARSLAVPNGPMEQLRS